MLVAALKTESDDIKVWKEVKPRSGAGWKSVENEEDIEFEPGV